MQISVPALAIAAAFSVAGFAAPAMAEQIKYMSVLTADAETPPTDSTGNGTLEATYDTDTKTLTWTVTYEGLTGAVTAAHFHGPAGPEEKADPVVPVEGNLVSPIEGSATITDAQYTDLSGGLWYFNLHTEKFPDGELRGQVVPVHP